jgi:hypothetical protein
MSKRFAKAAESKPKGSSPREKQSTRKYEGVNPTLAPSSEGPKPPGPAPFLLDLDAQLQLSGQPVTVRQLIDRLAQMGCTEYELATLCGISEETFRAVKRRQPEVVKIWETGRVTRKISLRHKLDRHADKQASAAIFLAKNELGMRDQFDIKGQVDHQHTGLVSLMQTLDGKHGKVIEGEAQDITPATGAKQIEHQP